MWPRASCLASLCPGFSSVKQRTIPVSLSQGGWENLNVFVFVKYLEGCLARNEHSLDVLCLLRKSVKKGTKREKEKPSHFMGEETVSGIGVIYSHLSYWQSLALSKDSRG